MKVVDMESSQAKAMQAFFPEALLVWIWKHNIWLLKQEVNKSNSSMVFVWAFSSDLRFGCTKEGNESWGDACSFPCKPSMPFRTGTAA